MNLVHKSGARVFFSKVRHPCIINWICFILYFAVFFSQPVKRKNSAVQYLNTEERFHHRNLLADLEEFDLVFVLFDIFIKFTRNVSFILKKLML